MLSGVIVCISLGSAATGARNFGEGHRLKGTAQMALGLGVVIVSLGLPVPGSLLRSAGCLTLLTNSMGLCSSALSNFSEKKWKKGAVQLLAGSLSATFSSLFPPGYNRILDMHVLSGAAGTLSFVGRKVWSSSDKMLGGCLSRTATAALSLGLDRLASAAIHARNAISTEKKEIVQEQTLPIYV